jgi:hypothetical protein
MPCPCLIESFSSPCCRWDGNESLCVCADLGLVADGG